MADRGVRDRVVVATKASPTDKEHPLRGREIRAACDRSLRNLRTDRIDLYYAHHDDETTPLEETLTRVRRAGAGGEGPLRGRVELLGGAAGRRRWRLRAAGVDGFVALQTHYNLMERTSSRGSCATSSPRMGWATCPTSALAKGFLTGKYRAGETGRLAPGEAGRRSTSGRRGTACSARSGRWPRRAACRSPAVALRWLADQPTVVAPIASARSVEQLAELLPMQDLVLADEERQRITDASA